MSIKSFSLFISLPLFFLFSCSHELNLNKIQRQAVQMNDNKFIEYVVLKNGDTLQGENLKFRYYKQTFSSPPITYNKKKISFTDVVCYQNKDAFCLYDNETKHPIYRLCYGKINMFYSVPTSTTNIINTSAQVYSPRQSDMQSSTSGGDVYYTVDEKTFYPNTDITKLKDLIKNNSNALSYYNKSIKRKGKTNYIPYPKLYEIINIYNQN